MKIFKSIKWRLQIWYGLILVAVLASLGMTAYQLERNQQFDHINAELDHRFSAITAALRQQHPPGHGGPPFDHPPLDRMPDDLPPLENPQPHEFHLPPQAAGLFGTNDVMDSYFIVAAKDGTVLGQTKNLPQKVVFDPRFPAEWRDWQAQNPSPINNPFPHPIYSVNGDDREMFFILPSGEAIVVGCNIAPELHELKMTALKLTGVGVIVLFFGLAGGWWISSRAIRPVENISATAMKIAAGDLSQRINAAETESELGQLTAVLNSTFMRLESAFAQQKQFASDAAHELRTPVSVILTQTQTALNRERQAQEYKQTIEACQRAAQRMRKLISALLELARLDAGQEQMKRLRFDLSKTVADCIELVRPLAEGHGLTIEKELSPTEINGDSERLSMIVTNLLTNAIQYNHDGGEVKITTKQENGMAILIVKNTGQGIAAEDLPRIFERFYQSDKSRTSGNAGLGLAISKAIVAAHGGSIDVTSDESTWTIFIVRLPLN